MKDFIESIKNNPVRVYSVMFAVATLIAKFVADFPTTEVLAIMAAILGMGEAVREKVIPVRKQDETNVW